MIGEIKRTKFTEVFQEQVDGSLSPKFQLEVNGVKFGPGVSFQKGVSFGGVDFQIFKYRDVALEELEGGAFKIVGFYKE